MAEVSDKISMYLLADSPTEAIMHLYEADGDKNCFVLALIGLLTLQHKQRQGLRGDLAKWADFEKALRIARDKHPVFATGLNKAFHVVLDEILELGVAIEDSEPEERVRAEAMDVMVTAFRLWNEEYKN